uniref:hypothetical protein n=1 Tax=Bradyrhizobium viridifuturi TaxID=1654716 RepID=UPI003D322CD3
VAACMAAVSAVCMAAARRSLPWAVAGILPADIFGGARFAGAPAFGPRFAGAGFHGGRFFHHGGFFHHHRFHRFAFFGGPFVYADYYDGCYRRVWTSYGLQWVNVCGDYW